LSKNGEAGDGVATVKVPHLTITLDPRTWQVTIGGSVPTLELAKFLLQTALDTAERQIRERDVQRLVTAHMPVDLGNVRG
jgi:hypothetical protein